METLFRFLLIALSVSAQIMIILFMIDFVITTVINEVKDIRNDIIEAFGKKEHV